VLILCAFEAALHTARLSMLALNEPPIPTTIEVGNSPDVIDKFNALVKAGRNEAALLLANRVSGTPAEELARLRSLPSWRAHIRAAHTVPREVMGVRNYAFDPGRFKRLTTPILFLLGSESPPVYQAATCTLQGSPPHSRIARSTGQGLDAALTAPHLLRQAVVNFFRKDR
jgi:pimeloyl-ACP methyl ester carboxylesterase